MPLHRLCIFDLDGTFAETAPDLVAALNRLLIEEGLPQADFKEARAYVGHGARILIERAHRANGIELDNAQAVALTDRFIAHYAAHIADETYIFEHALTSMETMREAGWRFAICTNKREHLARQLLGALGVLEAFEAICGGDTFEMRKPNGQHILKTVEAAGGAPGGALMVGDSAPDIDAAKDAKIPVVGVTFGYTPGTISDLRPDKVISSFADLPAVAEALVPPQNA
ncbi:MAG: HAD hydrolase-like protein [Pseudomonadota bacterium]